MNELQDTIGKSNRKPGRVRRMVRWLFCWRTVRRGLFVVACLATLVALFYAVENWRGQRAWEQCRRELEAKGEVLDWNAFIPAPVPDDQNIYKAPNMTEWFVKGALTKSGSGGTSGSSNAAAPFKLATRQNATNVPVLVAEVQVVSANEPLPEGKADAVLRFDDLAAAEQAAALIRGRIGPCAEGATRCAITAGLLDKVTPVQLVIQANKAPTAKALAEFLPRGVAPPNPCGSGDRSDFQIEAAGTNEFLVSLQPPIYTAVEYLELSQPAVPNLDAVRRALERRFARIDGDYQQPFERSIPNFVQMRTVAQLQAQRAQCYLLLGQPEAACRELALVRDLCRLLEAKPASDCPTLVEAMIDVAISGLYTATVQDGLRLGVWREPELFAMQRQLREINLLPLLQRAFQAERAGVCRTFETIPFTEWFSSGRNPRGLWARLKDPELLAADLLPRGWLYQNMTAVARLGQLSIELFDVPNIQVLPRKAEENHNQVLTALKRRTPYTVFAAIAVPNFARTSQIMARTQTLANEAYIACGLERYRLAHGDYPETLEALVPQFAEKLPHDIIGGEPLKYHRTSDGTFVLYSVGWNEKDDGGVPAKTVGEGDWVWF